MAASNGLIWKVAAGVFIGGTACLLATCGLLAVGGSAVIQQSQDAKVEAIQGWMEETNRATAEANRQYEENTRRQQEQFRLRAEQEEAMKAPVPLKADERCVGETRLRRIENGWIQSGSCP